MNNTEIEFELAKIKSEAERQNRLWDKFGNWLKDKYKEHSKELISSCAPEFHDGYLECLDDIENYLFELHYNEDDESEGEPDEEESGCACKYYDDRDGCIFFVQGSGRPEDMPCWKGGGN